MKQASTGTMPAALLARPDLFDDLKPYWIAWMDLHKTRQCGFGPTAISFAEILSYMKLMFIPRSEWREYTEYVLMIDEQWLVWARNKTSPDNKKPKELGVQNHADNAANH